MPWRYKAKTTTSTSRIVGALLAIGFFVVGLLSLDSTSIYAAAGINQTVNYQGRLLTAAGAVVADGTYNMQFKVYQDGPGNVAGDTGGTLMWTESWVYGVNTPDNRVTVKNGYFSVPLGSICSFSSTSCTANTGNAQTNTVVDFNQDTLWLSMNVGNTTTAATFGGASGDGEMLPMRRLAANVYAFNAGKVGGLASSQFVQLGQGIQAATSTTNAAIGINQTGATASILDLQRGGADVQLINNSGQTLFRPTVDSQTALQVQKAGTTTVSFTVDTTNSRIGIGTGAPAYAVDAVGSVNASISLKVAGTDVCTSSGCTPASGSTSYIQNQNASAQTSSNFWISGNGAANSFHIAAGGNLDTVAAGALNIGNSVATSIAIGKSGVPTTLPGTINVGGGLITTACGIPGCQTQLNGDGGGRITVENNSQGPLIDLTGLLYATNTAARGGFNALYLADTAANQTSPLALIRGGATPGAAASLLQLQDSSGNINATFNNIGSQLQLGRIAASGSVAQGSLILGDGTTDSFGATLNTSTLTANRTISLPDAAGTLCLTTTCATGTPASYIQNQNAGSQASSNFWISGVGRADTGVQTPLLNTAAGTTSATLQIASGAASGGVSGNINIDPGSFTSGTPSLNLGTSNARAIALGNIVSGTNTTINSNGTLLLQGAVGTNYTIGTATGTGTITIGKSTAANTISIGNAAATAVQAINIGTGSAGAGSDVVSLGSTNGASSTAVQGGTGNITLTTNSSSASIIAKSLTNSTTAFQVQDTTGAAVLGVNTLSGQVAVSNTSNTTPLSVSTSATTGSINLSTGTGALTDSAFLTGNSRFKVGYDGSTSQVLLSDNASGKSIDLQSAAGGSILKVTDSAGTPGDILTLASGGAATFKNKANSTSAFQIQDQSANSIFNVDSSTDVVTLGTGSSLNGQLALANSTNGNVVTLSAGVTASNYSLSLPTAAPAVGQCLQTDPATSSQLTFGSCGGVFVPSISRSSGFPVNNAAAGATTLAITAQHPGDVIIFTSRVNSGSINVSAVSGGNATNWQRVKTLADGGNTYRTEMWIGTTTTSGAATITVTYSGATTGLATELVADSLTAGLGVGSLWAADVTNSQVNGASTTVTYPSLLSAVTGEAYWGYGIGGSAGTAGSTSGFGYSITPAKSADIALNPFLTAGTTYAPTATQASSGYSDVIAAIIRVSSVANSAINNSALTVQAANFNVQAATSGSVAGVLRANAAGTGDIIDLQNGAGANQVSVTSAGTLLVSSGVVTIQATGSDSGNSLQVLDNGGGTILNVDANNSIVTSGGSLVASKTLAVTGVSTLGGGANGIQLKVKAAAAQTNANPLLQLVTSAGAELIRINSIENTSAFIGYQAGSSATNTGTSNTGIGSSSLAVNASATDNSALGYQTLKSITTGGKNTAVGSSALANDISGAGNSAFGYQALISNTAANNTGVGFQALNATSGSNNTGVGYKSFFSNTTGQYNSALGFQAGYQDATSGFASGAVLQNATAIGSYSQVQVSNAIVLGAIDTPTNIGIGTTIPANLLSVSGVDTSTGTISQSASTTVTGVGTAFAATMVGETLIYADGTTDTIATYTSATQITVGTSRTHASSNFRIHHTGFQVTAAGNAYVQNTSATAFQVQNTAGSASFTVDTTAGKVQIGSATTDTTQVNFQIDSSSNFADAGTCSSSVSQGAMYYNSISGTVRTCANALWDDVTTTSGLGILLFGVMPDSGTAPGDVVSISATGAGPCKVTIGGTTATLSWTACTAYSGGRKVLVTAGTVTATNASVGNVQHLCLNGTNNQPALTTSAGEAAGFPAFSVTAPILCIADIKFAAANNTITQIYDTRTFSTSTKQYANIVTTAAGLGYLVTTNSVTGQYLTQATQNVGKLAGVVVATDGSTTANSINAIIATAGPGYVKMGTATQNDFIQNYGTTQGYGYTVAAGATTGSIYGQIGLAGSTLSTTCGINADDCRGSVYTDIHIH